MDQQPHLRDHISLIEATTRPAKLETTPLPYGMRDLAPVMTQETLEYHYEHLARGYAKRYNSGEGDADFNRAGSYLHNRFFTQFRAPRGGNRPRAAVAELIDQKFKNYETFQDAFKETALGIQGSGWCYLSTAGDIKTIANHAVRTDIALLLDMWEHAYALDHKWNKEDWIDGFWRVINWDVINERL